MLLIDCFLFVNEHDTVVHARSHARRKLCKLFLKNFSSNNL